jgi:hypothetical protein
VWCDWTTGPNILQFLHCAALTAIKNEMIHSGEKKDRKSSDSKAFTKEPDKTKVSDNIMRIQHGNNVIRNNVDSKLIVSMSQCVGMEFSYISINGDTVMVNMFSSCDGKYMKEPSHSWYARSLSSISNAYVVPKGRYRGVNIDCGGHNIHSRPINNNELNNAEKDQIIETLVGDKFDKKKSENGGSILE